MKTLIRFLIFVLAFPAGIVFAHENDAAVKFIENKGQWPKQVNFKRLGSQGYVKGGPSAWIAGANKILMKK